jgi:uncharacterized protein YbdZ (MbtH family)
MNAQSNDGVDLAVYKVVVNHEEQYSIWPAYREIPAGWKDADKAGSKAECLAHIREVWTDMRPLSLRERTAGDAARRGTETERPQELPEVEEVDLITRLAAGDQPVEVVLRPVRDAQALQKRLEQGHVHVKFTGTRGGTELAVELDRGLLVTSQADFAAQTGSVHMEGVLMLNGRKARCIADIDLATLEGQGRLQPVAAADRLNGTVESAPDDRPGNLKTESIGGKLNGTS